MQRDPYPPWNERLPLAFWRGSITGSKDIDLKSLKLNHRYQLARLSRIWPDRLDARINRVVQCRNSQACAQVEHRLRTGRIIEFLNWPMACLPPCLANRHRRQCEFVGAAVEAALGKLHPGGAKPKAAVVPPAPPALGSPCAYTSRSERSRRTAFVVQQPPPECAAIAAAGKA